MKQARSTDTYLSEEDRDFLKQYFKEIKDYKPLSAGQEAKLAQRIQNGDQEARKILINSNLRFVVTIAKQYQHISQTLKLSDLINEGNYGLIKAVDKFDGGAGFKFVSYAVYWIRESILQALANTGRTIRLPMGQVALLGKINKTISEFEVKNGRAPSDSEIAEILDIVDEKVSSIINSSAKGISLDATHSDEDDRTLIETIEDPYSEAADSSLINESCISEVKQILSKLPPDAHYVLGHLIGFGYEKKTLNEMEIEFKRSPQYVKRAKERALKQLQRRASEKEYKIIMELLNNPKIADITQKTE